MQLHIEWIQYTRNKSPLKYLPTYNANKLFLFYSIHTNLNSTTYAKYHLNCVVDFACGLPTVVVLFTRPNSVY